MPKAEVAILSYCSYSAPVCAVSDCNHQRYADEHGYAYVRPLYDSPKWHGARLMLHGTRYKLWSILEELPSYKWVLWIDADALFLRMEEPIGHWIKQATTRPPGPPPRLAPARPPAWTRREATLQPPARARCLSVPPRLLFGVPACVRAGDRQGRAHARGP